MSLRAAIAAVAVTAAVVLTNAAEASISRVVSGHVGSTYGPLGGNANYLFPLQTGLNKVTIQGNIAMSTAKSVSLGSLKATVSIVGKGANYLHLNITVSGEAPDGQTGDGIIIQPVSAGTPDKFRWKVYKRGGVTNIDGPTTITLGTTQTIVFRGANMDKARLVNQPQSFSSATRASRSTTAVVYSIRFDQCSNGSVTLAPFLLVNEGLPPNFQNSLPFAGFTGSVTKKITIAGSNCGPVRVPPRLIGAGCSPGYYRPTPQSNCIRRPR